MTLRKEYQAIADEEYTKTIRGIYDTRFAIEAIVLRCQALADKPPKMLTDDEKYQLWISLFEGKFVSSVCASGSEVIDNIIAAHIAKQKEPETKMVKICIYKDQDGDIHAATAGTQVPDSITMIDSFEREVTI